MPPRRDRLIRPLYEVTRAEIENYLKQNRLDYCIDASNRDLYYRRNFIRHKLLPLLRDNLNPQVDTALLGLSELLGPEEAFLDGLARKTARRLLTVTPGGKVVLPALACCRLDLWLRRRLLRLVLSRFLPAGQYPDRETVERLDRFCSGDAKALTVPGRIRAERTGEEIVFRHGAKLRYQLPLRVGQRNRLKRPAFDFILQEQDRPTEIETRRRSEKITVDRNKLAFPLVVRNIRSGDRFHPLGAGGSKKVGDYLTDCKLPVIYRDEVPVVCDSRGIVWLVGYEIDERVKVNEKTERVLTIERRVRKTGKTFTV
ncbi:MAG: hypothetical protein D6800_14030 [Candidatus Zixiibacteriota bacterium]|nr:MAG: hypothetical protein D6800_14030 [candidate division Zixibacteria bacterium]